MLQAVPGILSRIAEHKRAELGGRVWNRAELEREAERLAGARRGFGAALKRRALALVGEAKKASPF